MINQSRSKCDQREKRSSLKISDSITQPYNWSTVFKFITVFSLKMGEKRELFPEIEPYETGLLPVSDIHKIYYEQSGNKDGNPVIFM